MTPAINQLVKHKIRHEVHEYQHDSSASSYGLEAAEKMSVATEKIFKTLVISLDQKTLAVGIVPVESQLSLKKAAKELGGKKAVMADKLVVQRSTGYVLGGVSPLGQKRPLATLLDSSAMLLEEIYVSAGKRGLEISLAPDDLIQLCNGRYCDLS